MFTVGSVPYVNAIPLVSWFEAMGPDSPVRVVYDVPSKLPDLLTRKSVDAILVSSVDALRTPGRRMAAGVCIGTHGPVKSVRLFSKVPLRDVRTLALDASSMTSNRLAQIVLSERYGVEPSTTTMPPVLGEMLHECDACVLIGDIGMTADGTGLNVVDLGDEWRRLSGQPFVWAAWMGGDDLSPELVAWLQAAAIESRAGRNLREDSQDGLAVRSAFYRYLRTTEYLSDSKMEARRQELIERAVGHGWSEPMVRDYFFNVMVYEMDGQVLGGLREFQRRLLGNGFSDAVHFPALVAPNGDWSDVLSKKLASIGFDIPDWMIDAQQA